MTDTPPLSRRSLLKRGLFGGALLAVGGAAFLASRRTRLRPLPPEGLAVLTPAELAVLLAIADRLIPAHPAFPTPEQAQVGRSMDLALAKVLPEARKELSQLLGLFENALGGFLLGGRARPFTQLSPEEQDQVLLEWRDSRLTLRRSGYQALRTLVLGVYYSTPSVWPALHYEGPPEGFHQPDTPVWKGGGAPRPEGFGVFHPELEGDGGG